MLVDSHCHLDFAQLQDNIDDVLNSASEIGVGIMQTISVKISDFYKVVSVASKHNNIYASLGVHPCNVAEEGIFTPEQLVGLCSTKKIIGIGETGLDYFHSRNYIKEQTKSFENHIIAASITGLPVIVHTRDAEEDTLKILKAMRKKYEFKFLIHCFTGTEKFAKACLDLGGYISFSGIITFKNAVEIQKVVEWIDIKKMLIETDAPYLAPVPYRGKTNQPAYVKYVAEKIAEIKGVDFQDVCSITTNNFFDLFDKVKV